MPSEELAALYALRDEIVRKPHGTISEVVAELRKALEAPASAHLSMLYACLTAAAGGAMARAPIAGELQPGGPTQQPTHILEDEEGSQPPFPPDQGAAAGTSATEIGELEREVAMAEHDLEVASSVMMAATEPSGIKAASVSW